MESFNCDQISVFRNELKYFLGYFDYLRIKKILEKFLKLDYYSQLNKGGYWIRSLYFDTPDDKEYIEKILGMEVRKKIRLRLYDVNQKKIKLEIKNKYNTYMCKETASISRDEAIRLINRDKSFLLNSCNPILNRVYYFMAEKYYLPVVIVDYYREAFMCDYNNIRITFDRDVTASATDLNIFKRELHSSPVLNDGTIILEVKYNNFLPSWIKRILSLADTLSTDISKYCNGREYLYDENSHLENMLI